MVSHLVEKWQVRGCLPEDVGFIAELDGPFSLAAVAASLVGGHG